MPNEIAVSVKNVKKTFKLPHQKIDTVKGLFVNLFKGRRTYEKQLVLNGVSFDVFKGEFFGIVGRNGGGKSTLLKLLAGIYIPNSGQIQVNGKLAPFIELGVGFNPELTGRENVYLNGALLGFDTSEVDDMYDRIVEFAELEKFMDQKLSNYSSGMQVRLAFSVAIQSKADILLIDEVLAVGDANFQKKCFDTFEKFKQEGRTVIFVSHSMEMIKRFCDRVILINKGKIEHVGSPELVTSEYTVLNLQKKNEEIKSIRPQTPRETHLVETASQTFSSTDYLLEINSGNGRHVALMESIGIKCVGIEPDKNLYKNTIADYPIVVYSEIEKNKNVNSVTGLLLLDNRPTFSKDSLGILFEQLDDGYLKNVQKIYIHMPFFLYHMYKLENDPESVRHLGTPLSLDFFLSELAKHGFYQISGGLYGTDLPYQYQEAVFERIDNAMEKQVWGT